MPPYHPLCSPLTPILSSLSKNPRQVRHSHQKYYKTEGKMSFLNKKKIIPLLVFVLSCASVFRLLKITIITSSSPTQPSPALKAAHHKNVTQSHQVQAQGNTNIHSISNANSRNLTEKEQRFVVDVISQRSPCNLLVFGLEEEYSNLASLNAGGITVFLEEHAPEKVSNTTKMPNGTSVYKLEYPTVARDAFHLLKHARDNKHCSPSSANFLQKSRCKLALKSLPTEVYKLKWDVLVVDGPCGHRPECPGRMTSIYTASLLARKNNGNTTNVLVHDIDRMIEKWFSWEFLCEENLISSKGSFWNFLITGEANYSDSTKFCSG
ncbi:OLC1v1033394C1 [Oldenlandia corymbosa var. corymbosa]|uniref:OLC1v1033394C1 n=1 Tax=Oldenlandia corymbosa var. corymbosa TaxID=529605 RepID=A0AAV1CN39_OLDCO|nr:OLC1v1033394C1 [Oldenlandia corymbosa var. corymbosa]